MHASENRIENDLNNEMADELIFIYLSYEQIRHFVDPGPHQLRLQSPYAEVCSQPARRKLSSRQRNFNQQQQLQWPIDQWPALRLHRPIHPGLLAPQQHPKALQIRYLLQCPSLLPNAD